MIIRLVRQEKVLQKMVHINIIPTRPQNYHLFVQVTDLLGSKLILLRSLREIRTYFLTN